LSKRGKSLREPDRQGDISPSDGIRLMPAIFARRHVAVEGALDDFVKVVIARFPIQVPGDKTAFTDQLRRVAVPITGGSSPGSIRPRDGRNARSRRERSRKCQHSFASSSPHAQFDCPATEVHGLGSEVCERELDGV